MPVLKTQTSPSPAERIRQLAHAFRLPTVAAEIEKRFVQSRHPEALETLLEVFEMEAGDRLDRRVDRLRKASRLPPGKTFATLESRFPAQLAYQFKELAQGRFVDQAENVLAVGLPGVGKSHVMSAVGHELVLQGRSVLYIATFELVQEMLAAKRAMTLPRFLRKLDLFEVIILDDIGYTQQSADEVEVLFTLLAERYERRSLIITSNLVFSEWNQIFRNPMTTAAAIDRVVHHCSILEFNVTSYRSEEALKRIKAGGSHADGDTELRNGGAVDHGSKHHGSEHVRGRSKTSTPTTSAPPAQTKAGD